MFITNKRIILPKFIEFDFVKVEVVTKFKLLGILIDNKLNFNAYVGQQCLAINKKLYAINRLFYLPYKVKLQFFKSFILPYFDYEISLCIYYHKAAIRKLCKMYYLCLKKLFNFSFIKYENSFGYVKSHDEINIDLKPHNLFSFHHRLTLRIILFLYKIINSANAPRQLKLWLTPNQSKTNYNFRKNNIFGIERSFTVYGDSTFKNMFCKYLNNLDHTKFNDSFIKFKNDRLLNNIIYADLKTFLKLFIKFDFDINFYFLFK
jgi:hypothetical protein